MSRWKPIVVAAALACFASAAPGQQPQAGRDYVEIVPNQPTSDAKRVVVTEFFSYACPHCASFDPALAAWAKKLPADVLFERVAVVVGREVWRTPARLYYALSSIGKAEELSPAVFRAIHMERADWRTDADVAAWVADHGVDRAQFTAAFNSFGTRSFVARADQVAAAHQIRGVPTVVVDGKYAMQIDDRVDFAPQLALVDGLIAKARAEKAP